MIYSGSPGVKAGDLLGSAGGALSGMMYKGIAATGRGAWTGRLGLETHGIRLYCQGLATVDDIAWRRFDAAAGSLPRGRFPA